jgi:hypothetical protein
MTMLPPQRQGTLQGSLQSTHPEGDAAIRQTDSDAILARYSAVRKGYLSDPFVKPLLPRGGHLQPARPPLINIGTYVRSEGIDKLVNEWIDLAGAVGKRCQIVSLGAGSDTRFWRIAVRVNSTYINKLAYTFRFVDSPVQGRSFWQDMLRWTSQRTRQERQLPFGRAEN